MKENRLAKILEQFGLTKPQARLFYEGFRRGPSLMAPLAREAQVPRGTAYYLMCELLRRKFFTAKKQGRRILYIAASGAYLLSLVREREQLIRKFLKQVKSKK